VIQNNIFEDIHVKKIEEAESVKTDIE